MTWGTIPDPLSVDDLDIGGSDFVSDGDFLPLFTFGGSNSSSSTASSSYSTVLQNVMQWRLIYDDVFASDVTTAGLMVTGVNPSTDQIDIRVQNIDDGETVVEKTGITGSAQTVSLGPTNYTPSTTSGRSLYEFQIRNSDNSTSVSLLDPWFAFGIQL